MSFLLYVVFGIVFGGFVNSSMLELHTAAVIGSVLGALAVVAALGLAGRRRLAMA